MVVYPVKFTMFIIVKEKVFEILFLGQYFLWETQCKIHIIRYSTKNSLSLGGLIVLKFMNSAKPVGVIHCPGNRRQSGLTKGKGG